MQSLQRFIKVVAQPSYYILRTLPRYHTVHRLPYTPWHKPVPWTVTSIRYSTFQATPLDQHTYHRTSDETLDYILEYLEEVFDDMAVLDYDIELSHGVLTLKLGQHGTFVINKQPPNRQIWLSSPISGPKRYDYDEKKRVWFYHRDQSTLYELLNKELSQILNQPIQLGAVRQDDEMVDQ